MKEQIEKIDDILREFFGCQAAYKINFENYGGFTVYKAIQTKDIAEALYNAGYRKQEWISVEDRLPDLEGSARTWGDLRIQPSVRVLCACKQNSGKVFVKEGYCEMWGSRVVWKIPGTVDSVTHWMPLPEPPKMKGGAG